MPELEHPRKIRVFCEEFFDAVVALIEQHTQREADKKTLEAGRVSCFAHYFPPIGHGLIDTLCARPDLDPKEHAADIFGRMLATDTLEACLMEKEPEEDGKKDSDEIKLISFIVREFFEGPYHSGFLADLTTIEDWFGRSWIVGRKPTPDDERKIAEKLSRSIIDARSLIESWRKAAWEKERPIVSESSGPTTGQYL